MTVAQFFRLNGLKRFQETRLTSTERQPAAFIQRDEKGPPDIFSPGKGYHKRQGLTSFFYTLMISTPASAFSISGSASRRLSPSRIFSIFGLVAGCRGVKTVQQSS